MMRVGIGYDVHPLVADRRLMLGGVEIPHDQGLDGHSDADVVLHALSDAILGAAGEGDIGQHFPPGNDAWKDADSGDLVRRCLQIIGLGWRIGNADIVVMAEQPKIEPHRLVMRKRISELLDVAETQVNIKATTTEGLGFVGRREGIACLATVMLCGVEQGT